VLAGPQSTKDSVPAGWRAARLGDIAEGFVSGGTPSTRNAALWDGDVPWITSKWLNESLYLHTGEKQISERAVTESATSVVPRGNLIFATRVGVGKVAINEIDLAINQDLAGVVLPREQHHLPFIAYQLRSRRIQTEVESQKRGATIKGITRENLKNLVLHLPPLPEQRKIAALLGLVQFAVDQLGQTIALCAELKRAAIRHLLTHGLLGEARNDTELGVMPESWQIVELATAVESIDYGLSAPIPKLPPEDGVKIVSTADISKDGRLVYDRIRRIKASDKASKRLSLRDGDVLFNWRNSAELIGKTAVFAEQLEPHIFASFILRLRCDETTCHNLYLAALLNHFRDEGVFMRLARRAVNQANYNRNEISVLKIPLPRYEEQRAIADALQTIDTKQDLQRRRQLVLSDLFRTLLEKLMTAEVRPGELDMSRIEALIGAPTYA
jgi:type I restriction enzyme, S subunit